jgi:hypothetical protein
MNAAHTPSRLHWTAIFLRRARHGGVVHGRTGIEFMLDRIQRNLTRSVASDHEAISNTL